MCLYGHPNKAWEVTLPSEEVPPELPEPTLGINFARDDVSRRDWISLVAVHSDSWLLSVAFYLGIRLNHHERMTLDEECCVRFYLKMSGWLQSIHWRKVCWLKESLRK